MRIAIVDDHPVIFIGIISALKQEWPDGEFVTSTTISEALAHSGKFDVVVLDVRLTDGSDVAANTQAMVARGWPVVLFTTDPTSVNAGRALLAGAKAVIGKDASLPILRAAVQAAIAGELLLSPLSKVALDRATGADVPHLTVKEREVLILIGKGMPAKSIARKLKNQKSTIDSITKNIRRKYEEKGRQITGRTDFLRCGLVDGYVDLTDLSEVERECKKS